MVTELIPEIDSKYRTLADAEHRAMAGLSMGSGQTLQITLKHLDKFAWIGAMSGPARSFDVKTSYAGVLSDAAAFNKKMKVLFLGIGSAEGTSTRTFSEQLTQAGIKNVYYESPGTAHEWLTWALACSAETRRDYFPAA